MSTPSFFEPAGSYLSAGSCTPGADIWVSVHNIGALRVFTAVGVCPPGGVLDCPVLSTQYGGFPDWYTADLWAYPVEQRYCFQDTRAISGGGGGDTTGGTGQIVQFGAPFNLSVDDGLLVGGAIAAAWCVAYAWRAMRAALGTDGYGGEGD